MKRSKSEVMARRSKIMEHLKTRKQCNVNDLAKLMGVSLPTIRRDLDHLYKNNMVDRYYGGVSFSLSNEEPNNVNEIDVIKNALAKEAANLINDNDIVFINSSSTALLSMKYLGDKRVTVITNNANAIHFDSSPNVQIVLTGGEVRPLKHAMIGDIAMDTINKISASKCILGCNGISAQDGITTRHISEVSINELMLKKTIETKIVLCLSTKIGKTSNFKVGSIDEIDYLITNRDANLEEIAQIKDNGVNVLQLDC